MNNLSSFFAQNADTETTIEFVVSERFKDKDGKPVPWQIRAITEDENDAIRRSSTKKVKGKSGQQFSEIDQTEYVAKLVSSSIIFPDLKNAELQKSYGVLGAESLLRKMLLSGEYANLMLKVQEINGFDKDINDLVEEAKD